MNCVKCGAPQDRDAHVYDHDFAPAPSPEPQGSEGQRWTLRPPGPTTAYIDTPKGGISIACDGVPNAVEWKQICELIASAPTLASLLAVAEANLAKAERQRDEWIKDFDTSVKLREADLREALRVAEERHLIEMQEASHDYHERGWQLEAMREKLADSERRVKELEAAIVEWDEDEGNWTGLNSCDTLKLIADEILARLSAPSSSDKEDGQLKAVVEARNEWMKHNEYSNLGPVAKKLWDALVAIKEEE
jgi:hypothetical protein